MTDIKVYNTRKLNKAVRPYLVDVPVATFIWIRPDCQKAQMDVLKNARPSILFISSDGGRNEKEWNLIRLNRKLVEDGIDWECTVHQIYAEENNGLYKMGRITHEYIWHQVERCILLEDDHIPSVSFFRFCAEMLEKYKDDLRITAICGMNHLGIYDSPTKDYFFSHVGSIWGIAMWKRTYESFNLNYQNDSYVINEVCKIAKKDTFFCKSMRGYANNKLIGGHVPGTEFFIVLNMYAQNQLFIVPKKNMISCYGAASGSTHAVDNVKKMAKGDAQFFNMKTYELEDTIQHPEYIFPDLTYEKRMKRETAWHHPLVAKYRRIVGICKRLYYGDGKIMFRKLMGKIKRMGKTELEK